MTSTSLEDLKATIGCTPLFSESFGGFIYSLDAACLFLEQFRTRTIHRMLSHYLREFEDYMGFELHKWDT